MSDQASDNGGNAPAEKVQVVSEPYPVEGEADNDATTMAQVVAALVRAGGTDPAAISGEDAWALYVRMWRQGIISSGMTMPPEWERLVNDTSPLRPRFVAAWERHKLIRPALGVLSIPNLLTGGK